MRLFDVVQEFIEASSRATDQRSLAQTFERSAAKLEVNYFACVSHVDWRALCRGTVALSNYPSDWVTHFLHFGLARIDPVMQRVSDEVSPFFWAEPDWRANLNSVQRRILADAREVGLEHGVTVPLHLAGAPTASCSFVFEEADIDAERVHALHLMAAYLYEAGRRLEPEPVLLSRPAGSVDWLLSISGDSPKPRDPKLARILTPPAE